MEEKVLELWRRGKGRGYIRKMGGVRADPVEVVEGLAVFLDLLLGEPLGISDEDLVLRLVLGSLDGQQ